MLLRSYMGSWWAQMWTGAGIVGLVFSGGIGAKHVSKKTKFSLSQKKKNEKHARSMVNSHTL